ncbi:hypothetical protein M378DRAFT_26473 [Amanita muscaria Koide BX008]|uniref:Uncharacterized protein n=1 Tax=Amanita muscaria (strain Koide BX008) TaxID=946122 RepID=A0A0C2T234_AMAMK|nr:hypothetical protein M378DRAFT_26473 [Amanita muscaria Koide BX008]
MPVTEYLLVDPDEPYDWGAAFREIGRNVQEGLDAIWAFLHSVVQFLMQLPELIINALGDIDFDKVKHDVDNGVHQGIQFLIEHERLVAAAFFVLSLILGFPIGFIISIIFFIPQLIFLGILRCIGFRRKGVERALRLVTNRGITVHIPLPTANLPHTNRARPLVPYPEASEISG